MKSRLTLPKLPKIRLTLRSVAISFATLYIVLLAASAPGRVCGISTKCAAHAWNVIGDAVWLVDLEKWQTLFTGFLAIFAAFIGGMFLERQMQQAQRFEEERRQVAFKSARASLIFALNSLSEWTEQCARELRDLLDACNGGTLPFGTPLPTFPASPPAALAVLKDIISVSEPQVATPFAALNRQLQLVEANIRPFDQRWVEHPVVMSDGQIESSALHALQAHATIGMLFAFARDDTNDLPSPRMIAHELYVSAHICGFDDQNHPKLFRKLRNRLNRVLGIATEHEPSEPFSEA